MGHTWKSVVLTVVVELAVISSAQGQPVAFVAHAGARACLARSYSVIPQSSSSHMDPNNSGMPNADGWPKSATPQGSVIVAYVVALELLLAVMTAVACWLVLGLAGIIVKVPERPVPRAVPAKTPSHEALIPVQNLLTSVRPT
jgi:hypothetical protein